MSSLIWFWSLGDVVVLRCARALLFQTRLLSQLDTVVTGEAVFCQISTRQTNVVKYINYIWFLLPRVSPSRLGAVVGNYKMYEEDPDEVKSLSYLNIFEQYIKGMYRRGKCLLARELWQLQHQQRHLRPDPGIRGHPGTQRWGDTSSRVRRRIWGGNSVPGISLFKKQAKKSGHIDWHFKSVSGSSRLSRSYWFTCQFRRRGGALLLMEPGCYKLQRNH